MSTYAIGDRVTKTKGSRWTGRVVGTYSTDLTPEGYAVESETERGSVQIYPRAALQAAPDESEPALPLPDRALAGEAETPVWVGKSYYWPKR